MLPGEPCNLHDLHDVHHLGRVFWVGSVLYRSCTTSHNGSLGSRWSATTDRDQSDLSFRRGETSTSHTCCISSRSTLSLFFDASLSLLPFLYLVSCTPQTSPWTVLSLLGFFLFPFMFHRLRYPTLFQLALMLIYTSPPVVKRPLWPRRFGGKLQ